MRAVSRTELQNALTNMIKGIQRQPVVVRDDGEDVAVLMSIEEYDRILGRNLEALRRFCDQVGQQAAERGMTEERFAAILADAKRPVPGQEATPAHRRREPGALRRLLSAEELAALIEAVEAPLPDDEQRLLEGEGSDDFGIWRGLPDRDSGRQ